MNGIKREKWLLAGLLAAVLLVAYVVFLYTDLTNTIDNSIIFAKSVYKGRVLDFYELSVEQAVTDWAANYNVIIYIIFGIWNAPAYLVFRHFGGELAFPMTASCWLNLWSKTLIMIFISCMAWLVYKIVYYCREKREDGLLAAFLLMSSMAVFYPVFIASQLDSIALTFMLLGLYGYLKENQKLFIGAFMIAVPCKMFAILLALPLILLKEKNVFKAGILWISTMALLILERLVYHGSYIYKYALGSQSRDAINGILNANLELGKPICVFIGCYVLLIVCTYIKQQADKRDVLYVGAFLWGTFTAFVQINSYWILLMIPFTVMTMVVNNRYLKVTVLIETIGSLSNFFYIAAGGTAILRDKYLVSRLLLPKVMDVAPYENLKYGNLVNFFAEKGLSDYRTVFASIWVAAIVAVLVLTAPGLQKDGRAEETKPEKWLLFARAGILGVVEMLTIYAFTASANPVAFSNIGEESVFARANLLSAAEDVTVTQKISFVENRRLEQLILKFHNPMYVRWNMALVTVELKDLETQEIVFTDTLGCSMIEDSVDISIDLKGTRVSGGHEYEICLSGKKGVSRFWDQEQIYPYVSAVQNEDIEAVKINGVGQESSLYFQIR